MLTRNLRKQWLVTGCVAVALLWVAFSAAGAQPLSPEKLDGIRVGVPAPLNGKCCLWAAQQPCGFTCTANPLCPMNGVTKGSCGNATCDDATAKYNCNTPARQVNVKVYKCVTTGNILIQGCPPGTRKCEFQLYAPRDPSNNETVSIQACNIGDGICDGSIFNDPNVPYQPDDPCSG